MQRKKLYYLPGLISALILPILLVYFDLNRPKEQHAMILFVPSDKEYDDEEPRYTKQFVMKELAKWKKKVVVLGQFNLLMGERERFLYNSNREFMVDEMRSLKFTPDTTTLLEVRFSRDNTYQDFVEIINLANLFKIRRYTWIDNSIYLFPEPPPVYVELSRLELNLEMDVSVDNYEGPSAWEDFIETMKYRFEWLWWHVEYHYITSIAFAILIIIPSIFGIRKMRRRLAAHTIIKKG